MHCEGSCGSVGTLDSGAIADLAEPAEEHGAGEGVAGFAFVQASGGAAAQKPAPNKPSTNNRTPKVAYFSIGKTGLLFSWRWQKIPVEGRLVVLPVLVMVTSFSKFIIARMIPTSTTADLLSGMWSLLSTQLGAIVLR